MAAIITQQEVNDFIRQNGIAELLRLIADATGESVQHTHREFAISNPVNAKQAAKLAAKEKKDAEKAEAKAKKELEKAQAKAKKEQEKADAKEAAKAHKLAAKAHKLAAKEAAMAKKHDENPPLLPQAHNSPHETVDNPHYDILLIDHHQVSHTLHTNQFVHSPNDSNDTDYE